MNKTIYFGKVDSTDNVKDTFSSGANNYYYALESDNDQILIQDTCGRTLPVDIEHLEELIKALDYVNNYNKTQKLAQNWVENSINRLNRLYGFSLVK